MLKQFINNRVNGQTVGNNPLVMQTVGLGFFSPKKPLFNRIQHQGGAGCQTLGTGQRQLPRPGRRPRHFADNQSGAVRPETRARGPGAPAEVSRTGSGPGRRDPSAPAAPGVAPGPRRPRPEKPPRSRSSGPPPARGLSLTPHRPRPPAAPVPPAPVRSGPARPHGAAATHGRPSRVLPLPRPLFHKTQYGVTGGEGAPSATGARGAGSRLGAASPLAQRRKWVGVAAAPSREKRGGGCEGGPECCGPGCGRCRATGRRTAFRRRVRVLVRARSAARSDAPPLAPAQPMSAGRVLPRSVPARGGGRGCGWPRPSSPQ